MLEWFQDYFIPPIRGGSEQETLAEEVSQFNQGNYHWARNRLCGAEASEKGGCRSCLLCSLYGNYNNKVSAFAYYASMKGFKITRPDVAALYTSGNLLNDETTKVET